MRKSPILVSLISVCIFLSWACAPGRFSREKPERRPDAQTSAASIRQGDLAIEDEDSDEVSSSDGLLKHIPPIKRGSESLVGLYSNAEAAPIESLIRSATSSVDIEIYEMTDKDVMAAIRFVQMEGVKVRILKDPRPVGQRCNPFFNPVTAANEGSIRSKRKPVWAADKDQNLPSCLEFMNWMVDFKNAHDPLGHPLGEIRPFNLEALCAGKTPRCHQHGKIIIVDGKTAAISTGNFNITNLCNIRQGPDHCNRDYTYVSKDSEIVKALREIFEVDWTADPDSLVKIANIAARGRLPDKLTVSPYSMAPLSDFIDSAQEFLQIQTQYITSDDLLDGIREAKHKKPALKIEINLSEFCPFGSVGESKKEKLRTRMQALENAGIHVRVFPSAEKVHNIRGYLHAKAMVSDGRKAWIGSTNGSDVSLSENREFGIFFSQRERVKGLSAQLHSDFADARAEDWQDNLDRCRTKGHGRKRGDPTDGGSDVEPESEPENEPQSNPVTPQEVRAEKSARGFCITMKPDRPVCHELLHADSRKIPRPFRRVRPSLS